MKQERGIINKTQIIEPGNGNSTFYEKRRLNSHILELSNANQRNAIIDEIAKTSKITQGNLIVYLEKGAKLSKTSGMVLNMLCILANNQGLNKESISFTIDYYMERFNLNCSRKEASRKLKKDLKVLQNMTFEHSDSKHEELNYINMKTVGTVLSAKGYITVYIDGVFRELLKKLSVVDTPKNLEAINYIKYPNAYGVTLYVYDMIFQEMHKNNNGRLLSVESLLKNTFCYLPKEEHIKRSEQSPKHKILIPFINTLNYLEDRKYFTWEWRGRGNKELTDEEKNNIENNFNLFKQAYVYFKLPSDYPNQSKLIETRKEKIAEAKENKKLYNKELAKAKAKRDAKKEAKK